ncbi:MAG TPA: isoprenylcysteine carboxylmethyltransferase family protein [Planctomycetota bacterium]|nr:isoprenylcysteine carboxylmethyltransferase family protein [Planctomycetota bacterium]
MTGEPQLPRDIPPQWFLAAMAALLLLHQVVPGGRWIPWPYNYAGLGLVVLGGWLSLAGNLNFRRAGTPVRPFTRATALVVQGPYRFTRNPMYLGMVVVLAGGAFACGTATPWLVPLPFALLLDRRFIVREERFMAGLFGDGYRDYCRRVRRWL